ncbi:hypothetical protein FB566_3708 [Stackebrandtia endophytica]|uniref:Excreted virulence factor EspC (Type VII ESX diderm) n=1 Tax=Stackebrandtia endophytica TaxID=1496996 RepID=A0A543AZY0_9ACTN|nr:hypothetical protein [Stackebrandtia endophytica]TQL78131.1 hypothetical protein FB566_3708 [Stackebrandtia endophytica]
MEVDLEEILRASQTFSDLGATYASAVGTVSGVSSISGGFETGEVSGAWSSMVNTLWGYLADSQDNLYDSSGAMINYINAMCAKDSSLATDLLDEVKDYNEQLENTRDENGGEDEDDGIPDPLPEPDPDNPDGVLPPPDHDPAERPGG